MSKDNEPTQEVYCEDCLFVLDTNLLPDLWKCAVQKVNPGKYNFVRRVNIGDCKYCEDVNPEGKCPLYSMKGDVG